MGPASGLECAYHYTVQTESTLSHQEAEISWHVTQVMSTHAPIMSLVPVQTIAATRLDLTSLNTSANMLLPKHKYYHVSYLAVLQEIKPPTGNNTVLNA